MIYSSRGDHECYDLARDPAESCNLYPDKGNFEDLIKKASTYFAGMEDFYLSNKNKIEGKIEDPEIDEAIASQLKSMGYM